MLSGSQLMVVLIVLIAVIGGIVRNRHRHEARNAPDRADAAEAIRLRSEVQQLKERIQVLERVVTENHGSIGLDREIERLRDR